MHKHPLATSFLLALALSAPAFAQKAPADPGQPPLSSRYVQSSPLLYTALIPPPPAPGTAQAAADLAEVRRLEQARTPAQVQAAQRDDHDESIFAFRTVLGPGFTAAEFPLNAALSQHLREESAVVNPPLKLAFHRDRPFVADPTLHPVCDRATTNSYPSGHSMVGYLEGFALAQMLPAQSGEILRRADDFAHNRLLCGVHFPSDIVASRTIATALFATLMTSPRFQQELAAAKQELQHHLPSLSHDSKSHPDADQP